MGGEGGGGGGRDGGEGGVRKRGKGGKGGERGCGIYFNKATRAIKYYSKETKQVYFGHSHCCVAHVSVLGMNFQSRKGHL